MSEAYKQPKIPSELVPYYDEQAEHAHYQMAQKSLENHLAEMPLTVENTKAGIRYAELKPKGDYDNTEAVFMALPYANGWAPHMYLRARYLQQAVSPDKRLIVLPNNTLSETAYDLSNDDKATIKKGNIKPIIERQARLARDLGIGRAGLIGYSFGGMDVAVLSEVLADELSVLAVGAFEAPNIVSRTAKELEKDFKSGGFTFLEAAQEAEIPALSRALGKAWYSPRALRGVASFGIGSLLKGNPEIKQAMARNNLSDFLLKTLSQQPDTALLLADAEKSRISPPGALANHTQKLQERYPRATVKQITINDADHGMGDNIVTHALLAKAALEQAEKRQ